MPEGGEEGGEGAEPGFARQVGFHPLSLAAPSNYSSTQRNMHAATCVDACVDA